MEALNAVGLLASISVLSDKKPESKKQFSSLPTPTNSNPQLKFSISSSFNKTPQTILSSRSFHGGLVLLSSVLNTGLAKALTYEEALRQSVSSSDSSSSDIDVSGFFDNIVNFGVENPVAIIGGVAVVVVPLVVSQFLGGKPKPWGIETAKSAYVKLGEDESAQLVDIRALRDIKQVGSPDIKDLKKKVFSIVYNGEDKLGFLKKLALKFKEPENTTLFILDKFDGSSELVAELVTANGFKAAYAIKDGAEGPRGWLSSGLPWKQPSKGFSFDLSGLTDAIDGALGESSDALTLIFGAAIATGLGLLAFTEVETILEFLGSAAIIQLITKKFLYAEDRKLTLEQISDFVTAKIAPKDLVDDVKQIGIALLPTPIISKSLPAAAEENLAAEAVTSSPPVVEAAVEPPPPSPGPVLESNSSPPTPPPPSPEPVLESNSSPPTVEAIVDPPPQVNSVPTTEVKPDSLPKASQSLSPYPSYADFKPPTSPTPSKP